MKNKRQNKILYLLLLIFTIAITASCGGGGGGGGGSNGGGGGSSNNPPASTNSTPTQTAVGTPNGVIAKAVIGKAGGSLISSDGLLKIDIPADALGADTQIEITPLTNMAHGRIGSAYRLAPDGQTFSLPVTITLTYSNADLTGTAPEALGAAFQTSTGYWQWAGPAAVDKNAKTVTVSTTHFSDWSRVKGFQIRPPSKTVKTNESAALRVVYCFEPEAIEDTDGDIQQPLGYNCDASNMELALLPAASASEWSVNGVLGGNGTVGTVSGNGANATYTAPGTKPNPDTVAVSAMVDMVTKGKVLVVSNITVTDMVRYYGLFKFSGTINDGSTTTYAGEAYVDFALTNDYDAGTNYTVSAAPATSITFTQWDYTDNQKTCSLVANATTPFYFVGTLTILKGTPAYSFAGALQAQGTHSCTDTTGRVTTEQAFPLAMLISATSPGDAGILPLAGDGTEIVGSADFVDPQGTTQHSEWHFSRM